MTGIDISAYQGAIDFERLANSRQVNFVYAKATEGSTYADAYFKDNHDKAREMNLAFGAYHFFRFGESAIDQAIHFLSVTKDAGRLGTMIPMVDVEGQGQDSVTDLKVLTLRLAIFNRIVENQVGKRILIYSDLGDWNSMMQGTDAFGGHPFWIAEYNDDDAPTLPKGFDDWHIWQYTSSGRLPGIVGDVDMNRTNFVHAFSDLLL